MMLCSLGDDVDDNDHDDKERFPCLIAFDFPTGWLERRWELGLLIQREWPLISQQGPADASLSHTLSLCVFLCLPTIPH